MVRELPRSMLRVQDRYVEFIMNIFRGKWGESLILGRKKPYFREGWA